MDLHDDFVLDSVWAGNLSEGKSTNAGTTPAKAVRLSGSTKEMVHLSEHWFRVAGKPTGARVAFESSRQYDVDRPSGIVL